MLSSNLDVSEMFVERQAQRSSMHSRHLNEQLVRVLKTIGYFIGEIYFDANPLSFFGLTHNEGCSAATEWI